MKKRILALALAAVLVFTCIGTSVFAATENSVKQYGADQTGGYLAIGDSVFRGYGTPGYLGQSVPGVNTADNYSYRNVDGSAPYLLAKAVGCSGVQNPNAKYAETSDSNYWPLCYPGQTLGMTMDIYGLEDGFSNESMNPLYYNHMLAQYGYAGSFAGVNGETFTNPNSNQKYVGSCVELTKKASLITVNLGACDVFYRALRVASGGGSFRDGFDLNNPDAEKIASFVSTFLTEMNEGYQYWEKNFPTFIKYLKETNKNNATIVIVGTFNMVEDVELTDDTLLPIGSAVSAITEKMNYQMKNWAKEYGVLYADISNTESAAAQEDLSFLSDAFLGDADRATHPTPEGHQYIYRQILSVLPEKTQTETVKNSTDIVVDLGRFQSVNYVMVDGILVNNFTLKDYVLTIPWENSWAKNLTIAVIDENKKQTVQTYHLTYNNGYTASRYYQTNDASKTLSKPVSLVKKAGNWFVGLFKK